jgi:transglutaminase-like putative cysteine protease
MILEIQHETCFDYTEPVKESVTEVRMQPVSDDHQTCQSFHLKMSPAAQQFWYNDGFGNSVHHFDILGAHSQVRILAASVVETHPAQHDLEASKTAWPLNLDPANLEVLDFLRFRGPTQGTPRLNPLVAELRPRNGTALAPFVFAVSHHIHTHYEYARDVTLVNSPIDHLLEKRKGVCQDFTHLMIALLRSFGIPARYVSGYIHRANQESQSHAWCEAWLPDLGWVGLDPTNDCVVHDHFVKVAVGRDFTDVPPNKGVYRGRGEEAISVRVESRALERMPSLSWQQQLPALNIPLTAVAGRRGFSPGHPDEESQQQQQ